MVHRETMSLRFRFKPLLLMTVLTSSSMLAQAPRVAPAESGRLLHSPENGRLRIDMGGLRAISVAKEFRYVGGRRFLLTPTVDAEQHLFVVADSFRTVRRLIWIQIESRTPTDSGAYEYPNDSARTVAGLPLSVSARRYSTPPDPASDRGSAFRIVEAAGYAIPVGAMRLRLIYLPERPARREVMIIYVEADGGVAKAPALDELLARALSGIRLEGLSD
jgi:hypothetical protein